MTTELKDTMSSLRIEINEKNFVSLYDGKEKIKILGEYPNASIEVLRELLTKYKVEASDSKLERIKQCLADDMDLK